MADADEAPVLQIKLTSVRQYEAAIAEAEARGYARGVEAGKTRIKETVPALLEAAEDQGYARGVEEARQLIGHYGLTVAEVVEALDARLKPKGEAK